MTTPIRSGRARLARLGSLEPLARTTPLTVTAHDAMLAAIGDRLGPSWTAAAHADFAAQRSGRLNLVAVQLTHESLAPAVAEAVADLERRGVAAPLYWASPSAALVSAAHVLAWHDAIGELASLALAHRTDAEVVALALQLGADAHAAYPSASATTST
jgi:hypothetical protein